MDNLPNNPSNPNNGNNPPPPFGSDFNPRVNPPNTNNPYQTLPSQNPSIPSQPSTPSTPQTPSVELPSTPNYPNLPENPNNTQPSVHQEVAQHRLRDAHGQFLPYEHPNPTVPKTETPVDLPNPSSDIPKEENNFTKCLKVLKSITKIKWGRVSAYLIGFIGVITFLFSLPPVKSFVEASFPNSSPIFNREVAHQGILKSSSTGLYTLVLPNEEVYTLHFKPSASLNDLKKLNEVIIKGHLVATPYVIEEAEIFPLNFTLSNDDSDSSPKTSNTPKTPNNPNPSSPSNPSDSSNLPALYSSLTWEVTKTKTLIFTSGMRKIEQEGVYLESSQVTQYPQEFINYHTKELSNLGFKQTLNSQEPTGTTITFAKDDLFLTFGVKNIFKGSGDSKTIFGYKAFIEHN